MLRFLIWTAVSTEEQAQVEAPSLPAQRATLEAFAAQLANGQDYTIIDVLEIAGFSRYFNNWDLFRDAAAAAGHDAPRRMDRHWRQRDFDVLLALDSSRIGRREGIVVDFVSRTIDAGATIHLKHGGELNASNYGAMMMMTAYSTAQERRMLRERIITGIQGRYERGFAHGKPPMSHVAIRDARGKYTGEYILDARYTAIWRDAAALILEGVAWDKLEAQLYERFSHVNPLTGKPFVRLTLRRTILTSPMFWGHIARHSTRLSPSRASRSNVVSPYLWDTSVPVPEDVQLTRAVVPAVWTGSTAERIQAELKRRASLQGHASPSKTYMFSGLCVCDECGYTLATNPLRQDRQHSFLYMRCMTSLRHKECGNKLMLRYDVIQAWFNDLLVELLAKHAAGGDVSFESASETGHTGQLAAALRIEATQIDAQIGKLINELSMLPESVSGRVRQEIERLSQRSRILNAEIATLASQAQQVKQVSIGVQHALDDIASAGLTGFWQRDSRAIHQTLHQLLGDYRLHIHGKNILGLKRHF